MLSSVEVAEFKKEAEVLRGRFNTLRALPEGEALERLNELAHVCSLLDAVLWELAKVENGVTDDDDDEDPNG
jgi:hypothetical protein